jgi:hypothetical protein
VNVMGTHDAGGLQGFHWPGAVSGPSLMVEIGDDSIETKSVVGPP